MHFDLPHDTPKPGEPDAMIAMPDLTFRDATGNAAVLHRAQLVGFVTETEETLRTFADRYVRDLTTHYAIIRLNPSNAAGVVCTRLKPPRDEPTHIYDLLAKERSK